MISGKQKDRGAVDDVIARSEKQMLRLYSALQFGKLGKYHLQPK